MEICPKVEEQIDGNDQSKMLCNVIVRATHELHAHQQKKKTEIEQFLKNDCQQLETTELAQKVNIESIPGEIHLSFVVLVQRFSRTTWQGNLCSCC